MINIQTGFAGFRILSELLSQCSIDPNPELDHDDVNIINFTKTTQSLTEDLSITFKENNHE